MTGDVVETKLIPLAAELVGCVRDEGPDAVAAILARVPDGRHDALAVVLAAMVDPDARPSQLLAWTRLGPVPSRDVGAMPKKAKARPRNRRLPREHGSERGYQQHRSHGDMPACDRCMVAHRARKREQEKQRRARIRALGTGLERAS